ncbi:hypothetical protein TorRG33x02_182550, partial [Trema orientale]
SGAPILEFEHESERSPLRRQSKTNTVIFFFIFILLFFF